MLSKEVKDFLEGIHFFLVDGLKSETLSGKGECLRRGLLLQLEGLRITYPFLHFGPSTEPNANTIQNATTSLPYLNVEQQHVNSSRMSTSSGSSTNYSSTGCSNGSSTGYSGDGVVGLNQNTNVVANDKKLENYEDFEEIETGSQVTMTTTLSRRSSSSDFIRHDPPEEKEDEAYAEDVAPVSFRIIIGKCDHHGVLSKRSKGLLPGIRNSKTFRCVLVGPLLYLYLKESDDKQKKVIDLNGYHIQEAPIEDHKLNARRRDFAFQLAAPGKKTHIFFVSKKASFDRWMKILKQAISSSGVLDGLSLMQKTRLTKVEENFSNCLPCDHDDEEEEKEDEEFYEELNPEKCADVSSPSSAHSPLWRPPLLPYQMQQHNHHRIDSVSEYYSVPEGGEKHIYYNQQRRIPPERPPLPNVLRETLQQTRPLPRAPEILEADYEGPGKICADDEIYCEIEDGPKCEDSSNFHQPMNDLLADSSSLSQEIFDTINERVPSIPKRSYSGRWNDVSFRSAVSETYDVPSDTTADKENLSWRLTNHSLNNAPSVPPKGVGTTTTHSSAICNEEEESEYKVPSSTVCPPESLYSVPSNIPVLPTAATDRRTSGRYDKENISGEADAKRSDKEISDCVNNNNNRENLENDERFVVTSTYEDESNEAKTTLEIETKSVSSIILNSCSSLEKEPKTADETVKMNSSNSVKDMIAKLNHSDELPETSQPSQLNTTSQFRRSNKLSLSSFEKPLLAPLADSKIKIEVSKTIKAIKDDLLECKDKFKLSFESTTDSRDTSAKHKSERLHGNTSSGTTLLNDDDREDLSRNWGQENCLTNAAASGENSVYIAKFAFVSNIPEGLSFNRGDEILVTESSSEEVMWKGVVKGRQGLIPKDYLRKKV